MSELTDLIFKRDPAALKAAFARGSSPEEKDEHGRRALCLAAACGYSEALRAFAEAGADLNAPSADATAYTPIIEAAREGKLEGVKTLLELGANIDSVDSRSGTALLSATIGAHDDVVGLLLERGAKIDAPDVQQQTPLHYLCRYARQWGSMVITETRNGVTRTLPNPRFLQHTKVLETLLAKGADPKRYTSFGYSPLHLAAESGAHEFIPLLVAKGADPSSANPKAYTPMHAAADRGHVECLRALLMAGARVDPADDIGFTPLFGAVLAKSVPSVELLLKHGASAAVKATGAYQQVAPGDSPLDVSKKLNAAELVVLLSGGVPKARGKKAAPKKPASRKPASKKPASTKARK